MSAVATADGHIYDRRPLRGEIVAHGLDLVGEEDELLAAVEVDGEEVGPRFSRCETRVPCVARRTIPPGNTILRADRQRVPGMSDMAVSFPAFRLQ